MRVILSISTNVITFARTAASNIPNPNFFPGFIVQFGTGEIRRGFSFNAKDAKDAKKIKIKIKIKRSLSAEDAEDAECVCFLFPLRIQRPSQLARL